MRCCVELRRQLEVAVALGLELPRGREGERADLVRGELGEFGAQKIVIVPRLVRDVRRADLGSPLVELLAGLGVATGACRKVAKIRGAPIMASKMLQEILALIALKVDAVRAGLVQLHLVTKLVVPKCTTLLRRAGNVREHLSIRPVARSGLVIRGCPAPRGVAIEIGGHAGVGDVRHELGLCRAPVTRLGDVAIEIGRAPICGVGELHMHHSLAADDQTARAHGRQG